MRGSKQTLRARTFGKWLAEARGQKTQEDTAQALKTIGVKCQGAKLSRYENGRLPTADILWGLSRIYGVPADDMLQMIAADLGLTTAQIGTPSASAVELSPTATGGTPFMPLLSAVDPEDIPEFLQELTELVTRYRRRRPFAKPRRKGG